MLRRNSSDRRAKASPAEVTIDAIAPTGEGIGRHRGRAVFVPGSWLGERVRIEVTPGGVQRGRLCEVLAPSADRVVPPCPEAARCGGCDFMHAALPAQREVKVALVKQLLAASYDGPVALHAPIDGLGYRHRARLALSAAGEVHVGYRRPRSRRIAAVAGCAVLDPQLAPVIALLRRLLAGSRGEGEADVALASALPVMDLRWRGALAAAAFARAGEMVAAGELGGARLWDEGAREPACFGDPRPRGAGADGQPLCFPPGGFAQASQQGAAALARCVAGEVIAGAPCVELFAGSGTLSIAIAPRVSRFVAVEQSAEAAEALRHNLAARRLDAAVKVADANDFRLPRAATVVLDPPRAGAAGACARIAEARPERVLYVSCNPATLARDAAALAAHGYRARSVALFDLFPHTSHVETLMRLERG